MAYIKLLICIQDDGNYKFPTADITLVQRIESCGWRLIDVMTSPNPVFHCPALDQKSYHGMLDDIDVVKSTMFLKELILITDRACSMLEQHCVPSNSSWHTSIPFLGDLKFTNNFIVHCTFVGIDEIIVGDKVSLLRRKKNV